MPAFLIVALLAAGDVALQVDADASTLRFHVVHKFHDVVGASNRIEGRAVVKDDGTALAMVRVPVATFDSGEANRDANMRLALEAGRYPFVVFKGRAQLASGPPLASGPVSMTGEVELHGVKQPVSVPLSIERADGGAVRVRGSFDVSLDAHRVERPSLLFVKIDDRCRIEVDLVLREERR